jgi:hypothetical protein
MQLNSYRKPGSFWCVTTPFEDVDTQLIATFGKGEQSFDEGEFRVWNANNGQIVQTFKYAMCSMRREDTTKDGQFWICMNWFKGCDRNSPLKVWADNNTGMYYPLHEIHAGCDGSTRLRLSPDESKFATFTGRAVTVWGTQSGEQLQTFYGHKGDVLCAAWLSDSRLASGGADHAVFVWDAATGRPVREGLRGHTGSVVRLAFGAKTSVLVSASLDKTVVVWGLLEGQKAAVRHRIALHARYVDGIFLSPDERFLVSGSKRNAMRMWDVVSGLQVRVVMGLTSDKLQRVAWPTGGQGAMSVVLDDDKVVPVEGVDINVSVGTSSVSVCYVCTCY